MEVIIYMFHNDPLSAHASTKRMMNKMKTRYYWSQMFENIRHMLNLVIPVKGEKNLKELNLYIPYQ